MNNTKTYEGQSFLDKVIETTGSIENAFEMALLNEISISDDLIVGSELKASKVTNKIVAAYFSYNKRPATAIATVFTETKKINYAFPTQY